MQSKLFIYNTRSRRKEIFEPIHSPHVGLYVCGPTAYGDAHLGNARPAIVFDVLYRYLSLLGYKVRYVRNITDVGHLENNLDDGEDKILQKAKLEKLEPMEVVGKYVRSYHKNMEQLNVLPPSIEPHATAHILEQQELIQNIIDNGFAYEKEGSVYFDVEAFHKKYKYGQLSGRKLDELLSFTRTLKGKSEKKNSFDFALWKKAAPQHIMRWNSKWSEGFPAWHLECSCMGQKYLGQTFDIHGGGLDLLFPHHECEMAQSVAANGKEMVKYWIHNNMVTINGQKMAKSLGNFITLNQLFTGKNKVLEKAYSPITVRFFIMQAHYRSTIDFSNSALLAAEKGLKRLFAAINTLYHLPVGLKSTFDVKKFEEKCYAIMNDDINTAVLIAHLFDGVKLINQIDAGKESLTKKDAEQLKNLYHLFIFEVLGLKKEEKGKEFSEMLENLINFILTTRMEVKMKKDFALSDKIRNRLNELGVIVKDTPDGFSWEIDK